MNDDKTSIPVGTVDDSFTLKDASGKDLTAKGSGSQAERQVKWEGKAGYRLTFFFDGMPFEEAGLVKEVDPGETLTRTVKQGTAAGNCFYVVLAQQMDETQDPPIFLGSLRRVKSPAPVTSAGMVLIDNRPKIIVQG